MSTKTESPKLSPAERLARKRAAARLRQQRCRARKRQAMLDKKRGEVIRQRCLKLSRDPPRPAVVMHAVHRHPHSLYQTYKPIHPTDAPSDPWVGASRKVPHGKQLQKFPSEPIYNCVSFDSQKSHEEAQQNISKASSSPSRSPPQKSPTVVTPSRTPPPEKLAEAVKVPSEEKVEEALVPEEKAAAVAMLSLMSGCSATPEKCEEKPKEPPYSPPREVMISRKKPMTCASSGPGGMVPEQIPHGHHKYPRSVRPQQHRRIVHRRYEGYNYGQPMKIAPPPHSRMPPAPPGYYRVHPPVPPPHLHYPRCYYPPAPRYVSYEYE